MGGANTRTHTSTRTQKHRKCEVKILLSFSLWNYISQSLALFDLCPLVSSLLYCLDLLFALGLIIASHTEEEYVCTQSDCHVYLCNVETHKQSVLENL